MISIRRAALLVAPLAMVLSAPVALAQDPDRMQQIAEIEANGGTFMGAILVAKGDEILLDRAYGSANLEWDIANTTQTKFRIGSVTKQFTAASILLLQERGQLDIDQPVGTYLDEVPASWENITVAQLMHHTSGIANITSFEDFRSWKFSPATLDSLIERFADKELEFEPGSKWSYSNSGYMVLVAVIENVSGQSLEDFMQTNIFDPLEMQDTGPDISANILEKRASGYAPSPEGIVNAEYVHMSIPRGGGNLYTTTHDLLRWQRGLFSGKILSPASLETYLSTVDFEAAGAAKYAAGVLVTESEEGTAIWHGGGIEGFNSWLGHDPDREITVAVLANLNGGAANSLGQSLMTLARGGEITLASEREAVAIEPSVLPQYVGTYALSPDFKIAITEGEDGLVAQATGQPAFPIFPQAEDLFFLKVVDARLRFERDESGKIVRLYLLQNGAEQPGERE